MAKNKKRIRIGKNGPKTADLAIVNKCDMAEKKTNAVFVILHPKLMKHDDQFQTKYIFALDQCNSKRLF